MIFRHDSTALRRGIERNASRIDEATQFLTCAGPEHPTASDYQGTLRLGEQFDSAPHESWVASWATLDPIAARPVNFLLLHLGGQNISRQIEVHWSLFP